MVIVDSSVWVDAFAGRITPQVSLLRGLSPTHPVGVGDLVLCEVLQGTRGEREFRRVRDALLALDLLRMVDVPTAIAAAENYRLLRYRGITVRKMVDCLIATFCLRNGHTLLHSDRDFDPFEAHLGLKVLH